MSNFMIPNPSIGLGYKPITTFWEDFCIANAFGLNSIQETYDDGFKYATTNYKYLTEFVMVLNHQCWYFYEVQNYELSKFYEKLFYEADNYALDNLTGDELEYFLRTTD